MKNARILIIEDNPEIARCVTEYLEQLGYDILSIGNAEVALELINRNKFSLYLVDIGLPGMNGLKFVDVIRNKKFHEPVIVVTGHGNAGKFAESRNIVDAEALGVSYFLNKPFNLESLANCIEEALMKKMEGEYVKSDMAYIRKHEYEDVISYLLPYVTKRGEEISFEFMSIRDPLAKTWEQQTICLSCQVGCKMGCKFCRTGFLVKGPNDNISLEKQEQEIEVATRAHSFSGPIQIVFGGGGEFLLNEDAWELIRKSDPEKYKFRIFTIGLLNPLKRFLTEFHKDPRIYQVQISGHFAKRSEREKYMPGTIGSPLQEIINVIKPHVSVGNISFCLNHVLFKKINDSMENAIGLAEMIEGTGISSRVSDANDFGRFRRVDDENKIAEIVSAYTTKKIPVSRFTSKGVIDEEVKSGCGQLSTNIKKVINGNKRRIE